jgi:hypothetical protein
MGDTVRRMFEIVKATRCWRRLASLVLLAALALLAQTGGLLHGLGHLSDGDRDHAPGLPQHAVCLVCVSHAGHEGALPAVPPTMVALPMSAPAAVPFPTAPHLCAATVPYQVRAPPAPAVV